VRYYIDAARIVSRLTVHGQQGGQAFDVDASISKVRLDAAMDDRDFPIDPPAGAHAVEMPRADAGAPRAGQVAPDFSLPQPSGGRIVLSDLVKRRKAVLVTFWFYGCATCREEFPRLLKVYRAYKSQGFDVIAVDSFDERATVLKYVRQAGLTFPVGMDDAGAEHSGVAKKFGVDMYPTSYLVDGTGKVVARFVDFKEDELRAALLRMGMSPP
jgi:peroxiredoxin